MSEELGIPKQQNEVDPMAADHLLAAMGSQPAQERVDMNNYLATDKVITPTASEMVATANEDFVDAHAAEGYGELIDNLNKSRFAHEEEVTTVNEQGGFDTSKKMIEPDPTKTDDLFDSLASKLGDTNLSDDGLLTVLGQMNKKLAMTDGEISNVIEKIHNSRMEAAEKAKTAEEDKINAENIAEESEAITPPVIESLPPVEKPNPFDKPPEAKDRVIGENDGVLTPSPLSEAQPPVEPLPPVEKPNPFDKPPEAKDRVIGKFLSKEGVPLATIDGLMPELMDRVAAGNESDWHRLAQTMREAEAIDHNSSTSADNRLDILNGFLQHKLDQLRTVKSGRVVEKPEVANGEHTDIHIINNNTNTNTLENNSGNSDENATTVNVVGGMTRREQRQARRAARREERGPRRGIGRRVAGGLLAAGLGAGIGIPVYEAFEDSGSSKPAVETTIPDPKGGEVPAPTPAGKEVPPVTTPTKETPGQEGKFKPDKDRTVQDVTDWSWNVAHNIGKAGDETATMQRGIDDYNNVHGADEGFSPYRLDKVDINGRPTVVIVDGKGHVTNMKQMEEINLRMIAANEAAEAAPTVLPTTE